MDNPNYAVFMLDVDFEEDMQVRYRGGYINDNEAEIIALDANSEDANVLASFTVVAAGAYKYTFLAPKGTKALYFPVYREVNIAGRLLISRYHLLRLFWLAAMRDILII